MNKFVMLSLFTCAMFITSAVQADTYISGTYRKGANKNEPQPQKSKYLKTVVGGVGVNGKDARYVLTLDIQKPFKRAMFLRAEFQNPNGEAFVEEAEIPAGQRGLQLVHGPVKGLKMHANYWIKVSLYEANDRSKPIDVLTQDITSYADSTGPQILMGLAQKK